MRRLRPERGGRRGAARKARPAPTTLRDLVAQLDAPRAVWVMLPAGERHRSHGRRRSASCCEPGDTIIDGGNTFYKDDIRRAKALKAKGITYVDVGTSGGVWGLERGYCMMVGGDDGGRRAARPDLQDPGARASATIARTRRPARPRSARRAGLHPRRPGRRRPLRQDGPQRHRVRPDAGLCRRLRHPGQQGRPKTLPEDERFDLNLPDIAEVWRRGSVDLVLAARPDRQALAEDARLDELHGRGGRFSGEGRWTVEAAIEEAVPADVLPRRCSPASARARPHLRREAALGHALRVRRPRGAGGRRLMACARATDRPPPRQPPRRAGLRDGDLRRRGDLTKRLLMPALYNLPQAELLADVWVLGVDRTPGDDASFRSGLATFLRELGVARRRRPTIDAAIWKWLAASAVLPGRRFRGPRDLQALGRAPRPAASDGRQRPVLSGRRRRVLRRRSSSGLARPG